MHKRTGPVEEIEYWLFGSSQIESSIFTNDMRVQCSQTEHFSNSMKNRGLLCPGERGNIILNNWRAVVRGQ